MSRRHPEALYLILGETHPEVRKHEGESYRESLQEKIVEYGLTNNVALVDRYLEFDELVNYLAATDIYLTPYLNPVQIVSGTLAYAVGLRQGRSSRRRTSTRRSSSRYGRGFLVEFPRRGGASRARVGALLERSRAARARPSVAPTASAGR